MAEELVLTDPVVKPEVVTDKFKVSALLTDMNAPPSPVDGVPALVIITLRDNNNVVHTITYDGQIAKDYIKFINTGNFSVNSLNKRILQRLSNEGLLPGTVVGEPE